MAHQEHTYHDVNASGELELSTLSRGQLIQRVVDLPRQLGEPAGPGKLQARTGRHSSRYHRARARSSNANQQPATHADKGPPKSSTTGHLVECKGSPSVLTSEVHQHFSAPTDLHFTLNQMRPQTTSPHENPESHRFGPTWKQTRG